MTYDEAKQRLTKFVEKPDTIASDMPDFLTALEADYSTLVAAQTKVAEQDDKIRSLQDSNTRLFLMQTGQSVQTDPEPEVSPEQELDTFVNEVVNNGKGGN